MGEGDDDLGILDLPVCSSGHQYRYGNMKSHEQYRDWFALQLAFAKALSNAEHCSYSEAVTGWTNIYRRCGFGSARSNPLNPVWLAYLEDLEIADSDSARLDLTLALTEAYFLPFSEVHFTHSAGCFSFDPPTENGMVRIHFAPIDSDARGGSLVEAKALRRRQELGRLFAELKTLFPEARTVRGTSWLYHLNAYRRLFPPEYSASTRIIDGPGLRYTGGSSWGQFLDHQGQLKRRERDQFIENLADLDPHALWKCFPMPAMIAEAPVAAFYSYYGIGR